MSLFQKRPEIPRSQFKEFFKKTDIKIGQGRQLTERQRGKIEAEYFPKKYRSTISKQEFSRSLNALEKQKHDELDFTKKTKIGRELKYLKEIEKKDFP